MTDLDKFQKEFEYWQNKLGLTGYKSYFKYEPLENSFAAIHINQKGMVATVILNSKLTAEDRPFKDIKNSAKHEAIHLLIGKLENRASSRYTTEDDIYEAVEEIVFKLEKLL